MVSIIIVNYNGLQNNYLPDCLASITHQTYNTLEVIVVDNASEDDSVVYIEEYYPQVTVICNSHNVGFCAGNNIGYKRATGDYLFFLNNDTILASNCIEQLVKASQMYPEVGLLSPKIVRVADIPTIDSAGLCLQPDLTLRDRGFSEHDTGQYDQSVFLFAVCGAAAFYPKPILQLVEDSDGALWDEDFWAYYEDGDLAWRIQNAGYRCLYWPRALVEHHRGGSSPSSFFQKPTFLKVHTIKNRYLMLIKNAHLSLLWKQWYFFLKQEILIWGYLILHPRLFLLVVSALLPTASRAWQKRRKITPQPINILDVKSV